jgi:hypothetical protein
MVGSSWRYLGSAVGFGFGVVWMTAGLGAAIVSVLFAALGYGIAFTAERAQASATKPRDEFELEPDYGRDYEVPDYESPDAEAPLAAEADYGWPSPLEESRTT